MIKMMPHMFFFDRALLDAESLGYCIGLLQLKLLLLGVWKAANFYVFLKSLCLTQRIALTPWQGGHWVPDDPGDGGLGLVPEGGHPRPPPCLWKKNLYEQKHDWIWIENSSWRWVISYEQGTGASKVAPRLSHLTDNYARIFVCLIFCKTEQDWSNAIRQMIMVGFVRDLIQDPRLSYIGICSKTEQAWANVIPQILNNAIRCQPTDFPSDPIWQKMIFVCAQHQMNVL